MKFLVVYKTDETSHSKDYIITFFPQFMV